MLKKVKMEGPKPPEQPGRKRKHPEKPTHTPPPEETHEKRANTSPMYPTEVICKLLNLKYRRLYVLAEKGIIRKPQHGMWELVPTIQGYVSFLQTLAYGRKTLHEDEPGEIDYREEKAKLTQAQAEKARLEVNHLKGKLHKSEDVERITSDMLMRFKARITSMPSKIAGFLLGKQEITEVEAILKRHCNEALNELAAYDPSKYIRLAAEETAKPPESEDENEDVEDDFETEEE